MPIANQHSALLVIDVQEGMFKIPDFDVYEPADFLSRVSELLSGARSSGVPIVYVQHSGAPGQSLEPGSEGWRIHSAIAPEPDELVIQKEESDAFLRTALGAELEKRDVTTLIVCGMQSEYCVDTTCRRAYSLGYEVILVEDAHTTGDAGALSGQQIVEHHNQTLGSGSYVTLCQAADVFP